MNFISSFLHLSSFFFPSSLMVEVDAFNLLFLVVVGLRARLEWSCPRYDVNLDIC